MMLKLNAGNENGFVLIVAMLMLVVLTLLGIMATNTTVTELQIAGNDKLHKQSFYDADGGTEFASEVLEQNIACIQFSASGAGTTSDANGDFIIDNNMKVLKTSPNFWQNGLGTWTTISNPFPSDTARDMWYPPNYVAGEPHTNITVEGTVDLTIGASIIMASGYLGLGRSAGAGGGTLKYELYAQHVGVNNSESLIKVDWNHIIGREDPFCRYD